ncbi:MAG TPA: RNA polymerase sigma factor [Solirubrobacterales bacterium]|jgi:RNA polymerase sigma factor (sigma-70 family)
MLPVDDPAEAVPDIYRRRFERCFRDHYAQLLAFSMRRASTREIAEDVAADTFAVAWRRRDRIPDPALPWLYSIAAHVLANQYRSTRRRRELGLRLAHEPGAAAVDADPAESLGRRDAFSAAFALLAEPEREALRLVVWDGLDTRDAARVFGCSPGAFRVRLHRAPAQARETNGSGRTSVPKGQHRGIQARRGDSMTRKSRNDDALATMRAANPSSATALRETIAETELSLAMQRAIASGESPRPIPTGDRVAREPAVSARPARSGVFSRHRGASLGLGGLACIAVIAALIVLSGGSVDSVRDGARPSFAAAAVRVAQANPRLLVAAPGWSIVQARSFEVDTGTLIFSNNAHRPFGPNARQLDLSWYPAGLYGERLHEIGHACCHVSTPVTSNLLDREATTFAYPRQHPNYATVLSPQGNVFIEVNGSFGSRQEYEAVLSSLRPVSIDAWLSAMPAEVIRPAARSAAIAQMLREVPVPPGFDPSTLRFRGTPVPSGASVQSQSALTDRFMLAKSVTGAVACGWLQRWLDATRAGNGAAAREAVDAMATAPHWPVLLQMVREKGFRGDALPPHGQAWPSEILTAGREIGRGKLRRKPAVRTIYVKGRPAGRLTPAGAAPASVMGCL